MWNNNGFGGGSCWIIILIIKRLRGSRSRAVRTAEQWFSLQKCSVYDILPHMVYHIFASE